jgi:hypothetical protein
LRTNYDGDGTEHQEVLQEDATVKLVKGRKKRHSGKKQAAGRRGEQTRLTRGDCGSQTILAAACRKVSRRATVAWRKRDIFRKILIHGNCVPLKEVTASRRKITRCAGHRLMGENKDEVAPRSQKDFRWIRRAASD